MIQVTLQFRTLAAAVKALSEIPEASIASQSIVMEESTPLPKIEPPKAEKVKAEKPAKQEAAPGPTAAPAPAASAPTPAPAQAPAVATPAAPPASAEAVTYPVLQKAVFTLATKSRDKASEVVNSFGVKTFKELPADKWAAALGAVNAAIVELGA